MLWDRCWREIRGERAANRVYPAPARRRLCGSTEGQFVRRRDEGAAVRWIESAVAAVGSDDQIGFGPLAVQRPGALHGTDEVVAALHDHRGNVANTRGVAQQLVVGF